MFSSIKPSENVCRSVRLQPGALEGFDPELHVPHHTHNLSWTLRLMWTVKVTVHQNIVNLISFNCYFNCCKSRHYLLYADGESGEHFRWTSLILKQRRRSNRKFREKSVLFFICGTESFRSWTLIMRNLTGTMSVWMKRRRDTNVPQIMCLMSKDRFPTMHLTSWAGASAVILAFWT